MSRKPESAPPIFFLDKDCPPDMTNIDILEAVESFTEDPSAAICARRTGGLWRLYASTLENKAKLMANQFISIYNNVTEVWAYQHEGTPSYETKILVPPNTFGDKVKISRPGDDKI